MNSYFVFRIVLVIVLGSHFFFLGCLTSSSESKEDKEKDNKEDEKQIAVKNLAKGYNNFGYYIFYSAENGFIYYLMDGDVYSMNLDGSGEKKIKDNDPLGKEDKSKYIYVHDNWIYYSRKEAIYKMKLDGSSHEKWIDNGYGFMKIYNNYFYYFAKKNDKFEIKRILLDKTKEKIMVNNLDDRDVNYHVKGEYFFFFNFDKLNKYHLTTGTETKISHGQNNIYVFGEEKIYFIHHFDNYSLYYSTYQAKIDSSDPVSPGKINPLTKIKKPEESVNTLNLVSDWGAYHYADFRTRSHKIYYIATDGSEEKLLIDGAGQNKSLSDEITIIGDWVYFFILYRNEENVVKIDLYRISKEGGEKKKVKELGDFKRD